MPNIEQYAAGSGRRIKENGDVVNQADMVDEVYKAFVTDKNSGMQLSGSYVR